MYIANRLLFVMMIVVCMGGVAHAESWCVEQDGTGDFTVIQDAVDAAADGDTILIGPGRYQDTHEYDPQIGSIIQVIVSWDDARELSFIGVGKDEVVVGPDSYASMGTSGFWHESDAFLLVEGISFQYCAKSIITQGGCEVRNCRFSDTRAGVHVYGSGSGVVRIVDCECYRQQFGGLGIGVWNASQVTIENCYFEDEDIYLQGISDAAVAGCEFVGRVGTFVESNGIFKNNTATVSFNTALYIGSGSDFLVQDCVFSVSETGTKNLSIIDLGTSVELLGNIFNGGTYAALQIIGSPTVIGHGNHFFKGPEYDTYIIRVQQWENPMVGSIDLRNNYWGTDNPDLVAYWIHDGADDPNIAVEVEYEPITDGPMPTEKISLDGLKAMYRNGGK